MGINVEALKNYMHSQGATFEDVQKLPQYGELVKEVLELKDKLNRSYEANTRLAKEYEDDTDNYRERITELEEQKDKYFNWYVESAALKEGLQDTVDKLRLELDQRPDEDRFLAVYNNYIKYKKESYELVKELEKFKQHHIDKCNELSGLANKQISKFQSEADKLRNELKALEEQIPEDYDVVIGIEFSDNYSKEENRIMTPREYLKEHGTLDDQLMSVIRKNDKKDTIYTFTSKDLKYMVKLIECISMDKTHAEYELNCCKNKYELLKDKLDTIIMNYSKSDGGTDWKTEYDLLKEKYDGMKSRAKGLEVQLEKWKDVQTKTVVDKSELMNENEKLQFKIDDMQHAIDYLNADIASFKKYQDEYEAFIEEEYDDLEEEYAHAADVSKVLLWLLQNDINPYHGNEDGDNDE